MNLKLEKSSIRVRLSLEEARCLESEGRLQERLPMPGGAVSLVVSCVTAEPLRLLADKSDTLEMSVPRSALAAILSALEGEHVEKSELGVHAIAQYGPDTVKVSFEVDRFTKRGRS